MFHSTTSYMTDANDIGVLGDERQPRSRNAIAQARHRAKRKAYIQQLERTVAYLRQELSVTVRPSQRQVQELQQENHNLQQTIRYLRQKFEPTAVDPVLKDLNLNGMSAANSNTCDEVKGWETPSISRLVHRRQLSSIIDSTEWERTPRSLSATTTQPTVARDPYRQLNIFSPTPSAYSSNFVVHRVHSSPLYTPDSSCSLSPDNSVAYTDARSDSAEMADVQYQNALSSQDKNSLTDCYWHPSYRSLLD